MLFYSSTTLGDSNSLVESLTNALGGSCIRIWMRTNGWSALATSLSRVSWETGRTKVSVPSEASVQVVIFDGRFTRRSTKIRSIRAERETANASASMKPPRLAAICTVRTTTRKGWASSGTGYLPEPSVKETGPAGIKYSRLIQTPLQAGLLNAASCTMSSGVSASAVRSWWVIHWHERSTCIKSLSSVLYNSCSPDTSSGKRVTRPLCISLTVRRRSRRVVVRSWAASRP